MQVRSTNSAPSPALYLLPCTAPPSPRSLPFHLANIVDVYLIVCNSITYNILILLPELISLLYNNNPKTYHHWSLIQFFTGTRCVNFLSDRWYGIRIRLFFHGSLIRVQDPFIFFTDRWYGIRIRLFSSRIADTGSRSFFFPRIADTGSWSVYFFRGSLLRDQDPLIFFANRWYGIRIRLFFCGSVIPDPGSFIF
jgi:hypothetical protein